MSEISESAQAWLDFTRRLGEVGVAIHEKAFGLSVPMVEEVFGDYLKRFGKFIEPRP